MIEIRQNQRKPYNLELAWPTTTVVVRQKCFLLIILTVLVKVPPHK